MANPEGRTCPVVSASLWSNDWVWQGKASRGCCRSARRETGRSSDRAADDARGGRHGEREPDHSFTHRIRRRDDSGGRQSSHFVWRQEAASDPDPRYRGDVRLRRSGARQARRRGRIHAHRDAPARRRGRRQRHAPRQGGGAGAVGQRGERAGRRLSARPGVQDDGRGRLAHLSRGAVERRRGDRRGRGDAAFGRQGHRDDRRRLSLRHPRQDRRPVRRRLRGRPDSRRTAPGPRSPPAAATAPISASPSS